MATTEELLAAMGEKLDKILAVLLVSNKDTDTQIQTLRTLGFDWPFIGSATGLTPDAARMRKPGKKKKPKGKKR